MISFRTTSNKLECISIEHDILFLLCIKLDSIEFFIEQLGNLWIVESIFVHHLAPATPVRIHINKYRTLFRLRFLYSFFKSYPFYSSFCRRSLGYKRHSRQGKKKRDGKNQGEYILHNLPMSYVNLKE